MSLSRDEQRLLRDAADNLARTDPDLAEMLTHFGQRAANKRRSRPGRAWTALAESARGYSIRLLRVIAVGAVPWPGYLHAASIPEPEPAPPDQPGCEHS
jgi:hypothetical protein